MRLSVIVFLLLAAGNADAQNQWNGKRAAVVFTYDDALNVHLDKVIPALDSFNFKGTFYLTVGAKAFTERQNEWKIAALKGHELANHTMFHPCIGGTASRSWVKPEYDLNNYTLKRIDDEIRMTNEMLKNVDGKTTRTFAYPCGDTRVGDLSYVETISDDFFAARGTEEKLVRFGQIDIMNVECFSIAGQKSDYMIDLVNKAIKQGALLVFLFHGVGGEHNLNVDYAEHAKLLRYVAEHEKDIHVGTFLEMAMLIKK